MNILDLIESKVVETLQSIDGLEHFFPGYTNGYTYYTQTGTINIDDQSISIVTNTNNSYIDYEIIFLNEINDSRELSQNALTNYFDMTLRCYVRNIGYETFPKQKIKSRMRDVLSDIKFAFVYNSTLNNTVSDCEYIGASMNYSTVNDMINAGTLDVTFRIEYGQHIANPNNPMNC